MITEESYPIWIKHFVGILKDLRQAGSDSFFGQGVALYDCPCGGDDHDAVRFCYPEGDLSPVLTCFETGYQWLVKDPAIEDIQNTIRQEEENYFKLLERAEKIVKKITKKLGKSNETLHFLKDTYGIPEEITQDLWYF